jgi:ABC-type Zn uptake system ZnuABC Zn-binding protein ZnuA
VLVTFPALYCFAKNVAGDDAAVLSLLDARGPHDFAPTAYDSLKAQQANLVLLNGLGLDHFMTRVVNSSGNKKATVVELGKDVKPLLPMQAHEGHTHEGEHDPHIWLGIPQAIQMVEKIAAELQAIDDNATHKEGYAKRAAVYIQKLKDLEAEGLELLKGKKNRKIITHAAEGQATPGRTRQAKRFDLRRDRHGRSPGDRRAGLHRVLLHRQDAREHQDARQEIAGLVRGPGD